MRDKLRDCIDILFEEAPQSLKTVELKEEMLQNMYDRYDELILQGKTPEAAYNITVAGVGDISELVGGLKDQPKKEDPVLQIPEDAQKKKSALAVSVAVALYIFSPIPYLIFDSSYFPPFYSEVIAPSALLTMIAVATCILIFNNMTTKKYKKSENTVVEEFKEWSYRNKEYRRMYHSIASCLWSVSLCVYFILSFSTGAWHITWLIFLITPALNSVLKAIFDLRRP